MKNTIIISGVLVLVVLAGVRYMGIGVHAFPSRWTPLADAPPIVGVQAISSADDGNYDLLRYREKGSDYWAKVSHEKGLLQRITSDWRYRGYLELGRKRLGRFSNPNAEKGFFVAAVGSVVEGVTIFSVDRLAAVVRLGSSTVALPLVPENLEQDEREVEGKNDPVETGPTETPLRGFWPEIDHRIPTPESPTPSEEQKRKALEEYLKTYYPPSATPLPPPVKD